MEFFCLKREKNNDIAINKLQEYTKRSISHDKAAGSIVGAFLGDAIGATLEYQANISVDQANNAIKMPGGGVFKVAPGQITDDSEMALSLANGLTEQNDDILDLNKIAREYRTWIVSIPFDIGITTQLALNPGNFEKLNNEDNIYHRAVQASENNNQDSLSNGALMRLTPLAIWCHNMTNIEDIAKAVELENKITHSNRIVHVANYIYVLTIKELIKGSSTQTVFIIIDSIFEKNKTKDFAWEEVYKWWIEAKKPNRMNANHNIGFLKIAWTYALSLLSHSPFTYIEGIKEIILEGGDTDTNACIYGGILGAILGFNKLPEDLVNKLLICEHKLQKRPPYYHPNNLPKLIKLLFDNAPKELIYKTGELSMGRGTMDLKIFLEKIKEQAEQGFIYDKILGFLFGFFWAESKASKNKQIQNFLCLKTLINMIQEIEKHKDQLHKLREILNEEKLFRNSVIWTLIISLLSIENNEEFLKSLEQENNKNSEILWFLVQTLYKVIFFKSTKEISKFLQDNSHILKNGKEEEMNEKDLIQTLMKLLELCDDGNVTADSFEMFSFFCEEGYELADLCCCGAILGAMFGFQEIFKNLLENIKINKKEHLIFFDLYPNIKMFLQIFGHENPNILKGSGKI